MTGTIRYDSVLQRITPSAKYDFRTIEQTILSRKAGETEYTETTETIRTYTDYNAIIWLDDTISKPTLAECESAWKTIEYELELEVVYEARRKAYPSIADQLDMLWHAMDSGVLPKVTDFYDTIKSVKDSNPIPSPDIKV